MPKRGQLSPNLIILGIFVLWRLVLLGIGAVADQFLTYHPSFPYADARLATSQLPRWLYSWANFDGVHYLTIAKQGYIGTGLIQAFFPVYPWLLLHPLWVLTGSQGEPILQGLFLSNSAFLAALLAWFYFVKQQFNAKTAWWSLAVLLLFPTSFFFGALYSESLFFLLVIATFWAADKKWWALAGLIAAIASATRIVGIFLIPSLVVLWWQQKNRSLISLAWIFGSALGLASYSLFLYQQFRDPLYFVHVQSGFGSGRQDSSFILFPQTWWRSLKIVLTSRGEGWKYWAYVQEFATGTLGSLGLIGILKQTKLAWWLFATAAFLLPTMTGTFSSMPRYVLVCFPLWIVLAQQCQKHPRLGTLILLGSTLALILNTVLFIQGYWVA